MAIFRITGRLVRAGATTDESLIDWTVEAQLSNGVLLATSNPTDEYGRFIIQFSDDDHPEFADYDHLPMVMLRAFDEFDEPHANTITVEFDVSGDDDFFNINRVWSIELPSDDRGGNGVGVEQIASLLQAIHDLAATTPTSQDVQGPGGRRRSGSVVNDWQDRLNATSMSLLGRRLKADDPKALIASLSQAVKIERVDGQKTVTLTPHTYAVQTELGAELTGAQASLYHYYKSIVTELVRKVEGLDTLDVDTDNEIAVAERSILRTEILSLGDEFGREGGPRVRRVDQTFNTLFGQIRRIEGVYGYSEEDEPKHVNTTVEERELTDFLIVKHYISGLYKVWQEFRQRYVSLTQPRYLGTQLVLLARDLSVIAEAVDEAASVMDSVLLGSAERQTIYFEVGSRSFKNLPDEEYYYNGQHPTPVDDRLPREQEQISLEDLLNWITTFATEEGPELVQHAGRRGVNTVADIATELQRLVRVVLRAANVLPNLRSKPEAFYRERVKAALRELSRYLGQVVRDARAVL